MDMAVCAIDLDQMMLTYAGANSPLLIVRQGEAIVLRPARRPVGHHEGNALFTQEEFALQKGDTIYLMSDGFQDQQGGRKGRKYLTRRQREMFIDISDRPMAQQQSALMPEFNAWRGTYEQTDDVCVMGVMV